MTANNSYNNLGATHYDQNFYPQVNSNCQSPAATNFNLEQDDFSKQKLFHEYFTQVHNCSPAIAQSRGQPPESKQLVQQASSRKYKKNQQPQQPVANSRYTPGGAHYSNADQQQMAKKLNSNIDKRDEKALKNVSQQLMMANPDLMFYQPPEPMDNQVDKRLMAADRDNAHLQGCAMGTRMDQMGNLVQPVNNPPFDDKLEDSGNLKKRSYAKMA